jgi:hypothetical protein
VDAVSPVLIASLAGCRLCSPAIICDMHAEALIRAHRGTSVELGILWAATVSAGQPTERSAWAPWPAYDDSERVRAIAWRKAASSGIGDRRITLELARACADAARAWYERRRLDPVAPLAGPIEPLSVPPAPSHLLADGRPRKRPR